MSRKTVHKASVLDITMDGDRVSSVRYMPTPKVNPDQVELPI